MEIKVLDLKEIEIPCDALVLPVFEGEKNIYPSMDAPLAGRLRKIAASGEFRAKHLDTCIIHTFGTFKPERLILLGLGDKRNFTDEILRQCGGKVASLAIKHNFPKLALSASSLRSGVESSLPFCEGLILGAYRFGGYKKPEDAAGIKTLFLSGKTSPVIRKSLKYGKAVSEAVCFARDLVNTPSNEMAPSHLAARARQLKSGKCNVTVLNENNARKEGMMAYLAVAKASKERPRFIVMTYKGGKGKPVVLIGKSITFDSGGISLKPPEGMEKMKYDMAGGAAVLGVMKLVRTLGLPYNVIGILPAAENLPGGSATRPGDIVRTITGKTVEIVNTDAEGRLVLADAMGYAARFKPKALIDISTLTGACSIALGNEAVAMMGNDDALIKTMEAASEKSGERVWRMPLYDEYKEYITSDAADLKNSGGRNGSLVTAGYFLKEFAGNVPWIHLDIASTAWADREKPYLPRGATGVGVRLLFNFLTEFYK